MKVIEKYKEKIEEEKKAGKNIIACTINYEEKSLNYDIQCDERVELLAIST